MTGGVPDMLSMPEEEALGASGGGRRRRHRKSCKPCKKHRRHRSRRHRGGEMPSGSYSPYYGTTGGSSCSLVGGRRHRKRSCRRKRSCHKKTRRH